MPRFPNVLQTDWQTLESVSWQRCRRWMCEPRCRLKRRRYVWWLSNRLVLFFFFFFFPWMFSCRASKRHSSLEFLELVLWKCCKWTHTHEHLHQHAHKFLLCCFLMCEWAHTEGSGSRCIISGTRESYLPLPVRLKTHKSGQKHTETEKSSSSYTCDYGFWLFFFCFFGSLKCLLTASRPVLKCHHLTCELRYLISELKCFILQRDVLHLKTWWYKMISAMRGKKHIMSYESSGDCINLWKFFFVFEILFKLFFSSRKQHKIITVPLSHSW